MAKVRSAGKQGDASASGHEQAAVPPAQAINERAGILGLQLQQQALAERVAEAISSHGRPTLQQLLTRLAQLGVLQQGRAQIEAKVEQLKQLAERVKSSGLASTSSPSPAASGVGGKAGTGSGGRQAGRGAGAAAHSKQFAVLAEQHIGEWVEQLSGASSALSSLSTPDGRDAWAENSKYDDGEGGSGEAQVRRTGPPVAHLLGPIPPELACHITLPNISYRAAAAASAAAAATAAAGDPAPAPLLLAPPVLWAAAPLLLDPATGVQYRVARHDSPEEAWPTLADGDLVLLLPGRYDWSEGVRELRAAVRILGLGTKPSEVGSGWCLACTFRL